MSGLDATVSISDAPNSPATGAPTITTISGTAQVGGR